MSHVLVLVGMVLLLLTTTNQTETDVTLQPSYELTAADEVQIFWIEQKLDHFNATDSRTWQMRYMLNSSVFKAGGPLFILVGGEWEITKKQIAKGHVYDMAREHNALLAYTEHRYYGESQPLPDLSMESLQFLSAKQALADLAHFIDNIKQQTAGLGAAKVILMGGSYAGSLVVWFMRTYPELAAGGWASSAPLYAKLNFVEYRKLTAASIKLEVGGDCYPRIQQGFTQIQLILATSHGADIRQMLQLCENFDAGNVWHMWTLGNAIIDFLAEVLQKRNAVAAELQSNSLCNELLGHVVQLLRRKYYKDNCFDFSYDTYIKELLKTSYEQEMSRQWLYQQCQEFGWFPGTTQPIELYPPLYYYTTVCSNVFGDKYTQAYMQQQVEQTNAYFGGLQPAVEHVYFTHGQLDAWRAVGLQQGNQTAVIPGYAHCQDFAAISDSDSLDMRASKERIAQLLHVWLK